MHKAAPNQTYPDEAGKIATAVISLLADPNLVIHEPCGPSGCDGNQTQSKSIYIRILELLYNVASNDEKA